MAAQREMIKFEKLCVGRKEARKCGDFPAINYYVIMIRKFKLIRTLGMELCSGNDIHNYITHNTI